MFKETATKYNEQLQEGKVYVFSNGTVKMANKKFSTIKHDFCLIFDNYGDIQEV